MGDSLDVNAITLSHQFTPTMHRELYPAISPINSANSAAGKSVLVTGATRGIGKAISLSWAQAGADSIVITGRAEDLLTEVSNEIKRVSPKTKVLAIRSEAADEEDVKKLWAKVKAEVGIIDVLICNAGVLGELPDFPITGKRKPSDWWSDITVNVFGPYLQVYNFLQQYLPEDKEPKGTIIILGSAIATMTHPGASAYTISKHVNQRQAEFIQAEHPSLRVFSVHPGLVPTQMQADMFSAFALDPPELTGGLSLYLSTPRADFLKGRYVTVNWDVEELEKHAKEIQEKGLLTNAFVKGQFGPTGHPFEGTS